MTGRPSRQAGRHPQPSHPTALPAAQRDATTAPSSEGIPSCAPVLGSNIIAEVPTAWPMSPSFVVNRSREPSGDSCALSCWSSLSPTPHDTTAPGRQVGSPSVQVRVSRREVSGPRSSRARTVRSSSQPANTGTSPPSTRGTSVVEPSVPTTRPPNRGWSWSKAPTKTRRESGDHQAGWSNGVHSSASRSCCGGAGTAAPVTRSVSTGPRATHRPSGESAGAPCDPEPSNGSTTRRTAPAGETAYTCVPRFASAKPSGNAGSGKSAAVTPGLAVSGGKGGLAMTSG